MADIVNLRQARKAKAKQAKEAAADANRIRFGRTKAEKSLATARKALENNRLEAHKTGATKDES